MVGIQRTPQLGSTFARSLRSLGHEVFFVDEDCAYTVLDKRPARRILAPLLRGRPSGRGLLRRRLVRACKNFKPDLLLAIKGAALDAELLQEIRARTASLLVMYSTDHPFNANVCPPGYVAALKYWDVIATPRSSTIPQIRAHCSGDVFHLPFGYDTCLHHPESPASDSERAGYSSDVLFAGGCDRDRIPFLHPLAELDGLDVHYYGGYYQFTAALRRRDHGYASGRLYRLALSLTKVALCLVRRANCDGHVMRTFETPACGAFMLAERTDEHMSLFEEDREAAFFSSPEELLDKAQFYIRHDSARASIARNGYHRVVSQPNTYSDRLSVLLDRIRKQ